MTSPPALPRRTMLALLTLMTLMALVALVGGCGAGHGTQGAEANADPMESARVPARVLASSPSLRLLVLPGETFFREPDDGWSVRFRIENTSHQEVYLDLASPTLVYPNQFGPVLTAERLLVDERRLPDAPLSESERSALEARRAQGALSPLSACAQVDIYVPFHGRGAALFAGFATPQMFVSLDGYLDAVRADGVPERLALTWTDAQAAGPSAPRGGRTQRDTDLVMSMPVLLGDRECRRPRRIVPRGGAAEWPVVVCPAQPAR